VTKHHLYKIGISIGIMLSLIAFLGDMTPLGDYRNANPRAWEQFDASSVSRTGTMGTLISEAKNKANNWDSLSSEQKMMSLYQIVIDRFTHSDGAKHNLFSNWLLYLAGKIHPAFGVIMDPDLFVSKGHSLVCSQSSYLLMRMALQEGITARHVGLNGHVVMEAWYDRDWHLFDPDAEVVPRNKDRLVMSLDELAKNPGILDIEYPREKGNYASSIASREDNSFVSYPKGAYFEWKSQVLFYFEKGMQILKYLIPILFIVAGLYGHRTSIIRPKR